MKRDPDLYGYLPYNETRPVIRWPNGARVAFWVAPNVEFYELNPPKNPARGAWARPYPDVQNYAYRDYGNRAGFWRMLDAMKRCNMRGSVSLNVAVCEHHPEVIKACADNGWEFYSHGTYNTRYLMGMDEAQERAVIQDSIDTIRNHTGQKLDGWLAPALTYTDNTLDLVADMGLTYVCDLFHDDQPGPVKVKKGRLTSVPYSLEMNDTIAYNVNLVQPRRYADIIQRQFDRLYAEGEHSGTVMCIPLHPYLVGMPYRIAAFEEALSYITGHEKVWLATGREIAKYFNDNYFDAFAKAAHTVEDAMSLSKEHLEYPLRRYGMDHDRYDWSMLPQRKPVAWPHGARVALWVVPALEWFPLDMKGVPFKPPGAMQTAYPDLRHYTLRDYGNRVGIFRIMQALDRHGIRASVAINAAVAVRYPALIAECVKRQWEVIANGQDMDHLHHGALAVDDERKLIATTLDILRKASGQAVRGWLSPAKSESAATLDLLGEAGLDYVCDWVNDDMPFPMRTAGGPIHAMPHPIDIDDTTILVQNHHTENDFRDQLCDQFDVLYRESATQGGRVMAISLHPWVIGQPYRIGALEEVLAHIMGHQGVWAATGGEILDAWKAGQG